MPPVERITIAGFRGIPVPLEISFLEGRNPKSLILYGRNGTGKSSVTDGWEWLTSGKIAHLAREGAEESSYPNMHAKPGDTYVEVRFSDATLGTVRLTFNPKGMRSPKVSGNLAGVRALIAHPCHIRHGDLTRFVLLTKAERFDALASLMGFVPQMTYLKGLRRIAEKLNADLEGQRTLYKDVEGRHNKHFTNLPGEKFTPMQLLGRRFTEHEIAFDETPEALPAAAAELKKLVVSDRNTKRLGVQRDAKTQLAGFRPTTGIAPKIAALKAAVAELKASQAADREKLLRIPFLRSAKDVLEKLPPTGQCPLCRLTFSGDLKEHVGTELAALERLETLVARVRSAKEAVRVALVDHTLENPVTLPEKYIPSKEETNALDLLRKAVKRWKDALVSARDLLAFDTTALDDKLVPSLESCVLEVEQSQKAMTDAKQVAIELYDGLVTALEQDPKRKKLVDDNEYVVTGITLINDYAAAKEKGLAVRKTSERFTELTDHFVARALADVHARFGQISDKVTEIFDILEHGTPGIGKPKLVLDMASDRSVILQVEFQGQNISPAYRYLSESQLNSFGLAVSLASTTHFNKQFPFLILDDVVNSCDAYKRPQLIEVLTSKLADVQVLLMTHDTFWRDLLHRRLNTWRRLNFVRYDAGTGPIMESAKDAYERIEDDLKRDEVNAASGKLALLLEDAAQEIGEALEIDVKFNRRGEYTLDPLLTAIRTRLEKKLGAVHPLVIAMGRITQDNAYRNWGIHCKNPVSPITEPEIRTVVANWRTFESQLHCPGCTKLVRAQGSAYQCTCGNLVLQRATP
jgi:hypothetical protein